MSPEIPYTHPCRRSAPGLTADDARLGADVVRYSFIVVDWRHLLLAGLPAHCHPDPGGGLFLQWAWRSYCGAWPRAPVAKASVAAAESAALCASAEAFFAYSN